MAKDTEKLIRQLSLISFLMAQGRPASALEIKREVEGYSDMNDDAFARRFYADRAELESLGITLQVEKPGESLQGYESELYSLPPENFYLDAIEFGDDELAALQTALHLLDGEFAYAEPLRLALQQVSWGRPSPLTSPEASAVEVRMTAKADGAEISQRLSKIETAISRRKRIEFTYYTIERDATEKRKVDPYHLVYRGGQFYLIGHSHERGAVRVFRLSRIRGKVSYASKAEHDFSAPDEFDRRDYGRRAEWQLGEIQGTAKVFLSERIAWLVERDFGAYGEIRRATKADGAPGKGVVFETDFASARQMVAWVLHWRQNATVLEPEALADEVGERLELLRERHTDEFDVARSKGTVPPPLARTGRSNGRSESSIRPERFARLVTLAGMLIESAKAGERLPVSEVVDKLKLSSEELRDDIELLNVVNFGGGTYVLYAELVGDEIEVDSEPYGDNFARPARLLPLEAKALVAAIDLFGDHLPQSGLASARKKIVSALGHDPSEEGLEIAASGGDDSDIARKVNEAIAAQRVLSIHYYKENEDEFTKREIEPYRLANGPEGWYVASYDRKRHDIRHFRLDRIKEATPTKEGFEPRPEFADIAAIEGGWLSGENVPAADVASVWVSPERARWAREEHTVVEELADGAVVIEVPFGSSDWLLREILKGAGDFVVLEPDDARETVRGELETDSAAHPAAVKAA
ncbi:MAG TPA: WYL domain-containing protein [Solirubrobacterales bacterium]|nr:WYL domain-containing protein [Solirubrobacterales bacterium]